MNLFTRLFLALQLLLFFPSIAFVAINFFEGEDTLHKSFIQSEVKSFLDNYKKDDSIALPNSYTTSSFLGKEDIPLHMLELVDHLSPGLYDLETEKNPNFGLEQEVKVMITRINEDQPYLYFFSIIDDAKSDNILKKILVLPIISYLCLTALFSYLLAKFFSHKISNPIEKITATIDNINESQPYTDFSDIKNNDEIGNLAKTIAEKNRRIAEFITREKHTIRNISHELRTPITALKSTIALIKNQKLNEGYYPTTPELLSKIERSSNDMHDIVEAFLWLGKEYTTTQDCYADPVGCIEKAIVYYGYLLDKKEVKIETTIDNHVKIHCPDSIFYILVANLVRNAFAFTQDGKILIKLTTDTLSISDTGPGVDSNIVGKIKELGIKANNSPGFGIGLHIVERICEHLGWKFMITANPEKQGVLATVEFDPRQ